MINASSTQVVSTLVVRPTDTWPCHVSRALCTSIAALPGRILTRMRLKWVGVCGHLHCLYSPILLTCSAQVEVTLPTRPSIGVPSRSTRAPMTLHRTKPAPRVILVSIQIVNVARCQNSSALFVFHGCLAALYAQIVLTWFADPAGPPLLGAPTIASERVVTIPTLICTLLVGGPMH